MLARIVVLENESPDGFAEVLTDHLERFQPADGVGFGITEEMVAAWWRMRRAWSIETRLRTECFDVPEPGDGTSLLAATFKNDADSTASPRCTATKRAFRASADPIVHNRAEVQS